MGDSIVSHGEIFTIDVHHNNLNVEIHPDDDFGFSTNYYTRLIGYQGNKS